MGLPYLLLQTILVPILSAPILAFLGKKIGKNVGWVAFGVLAYTSTLLTIAGFGLWEGFSPIHEEYAWVTDIFELRFSFLADSLSLPVALIVNIVCAVLTVYSIDYLAYRIEKLYHGDGDSRSLNALYYSLFQFFAAGLVGIALSTNLIEVYVFLDMLLIPLYFLIDRFGYVGRRRVAVMGFLWSFIGGILFLLGSVIVYSQTGSFMISDLPRIVGKSAALWAAAAMLIGILVKLGVFGFHVWIPWVEGEAPSCVAGILAVAVGIENYLIVRIFVQHLYSLFKLFSLPLAVWALATMIYGGLLTIAQDDFKRLYACSTICQTSYSLLGIASCTAYGITGGIFYFLSHCLGKAILFSVAGIVVYETGVRSMQRLGGLARRMPITATLCVLGSMILSGFPPLSGFQAEWIMFAGIFELGIHGSVWSLAVGLIGLFATFLATVYTFWPVKRVFFGPLPKSLRNVKEAPLSMTAPLLLLALISTFLGMYPNLILKFLAR
ncbi:NADH dehydrogenase [Candidatus Bathyarchaeota archaeon]|nr:NADH dehydrogenase [Candidatus Bathyarchaeota archaeon]